MLEYRYANPERNNQRTKNGVFFFFFVCSGFISNVVNEIARKDVHTTHIRTKISMAEILMVVNLYCISVENTHLMYHARIMAAKFRFVSNESTN